MRVAVNARRLEGQRLGVGRYIEYLVENWGRRAAGGDSVCLYVRKPLPGTGEALPASVEVDVLAPALKGALWDNTILSRRARADVLFCPSYTVPLTYRGPSVVAIHSTNEIAEGAHNRSYRFTFAAHYRLSARAATRIIVPSAVTKRDIVEHYAVDPGRVSIIPQAADRDFHPRPPGPWRSEVRRRCFGFDRPYVVFVGKLSQRRNIPLLLEAFAIARSRAQLPHGLLLFGPNPQGLPLQELIERFGLTDSVVQTDGRVSDHRELAEIYSAADLYVNASLYEGFSMTLVEALACGTPCLVARRGALEEIAGDAAMMVDDVSAEAFADGLERALTDPATLAELSARGPRRAAAFDWADTASRTWDVLAQAAA